MAARNERKPQAFPAAPASVTPARDFVLELLDQFDEESQEFQEPPHQRCLFSLRDLGNSDLHTSILPRRGRRATG